MNTQTITNETIELVALRVLGKFADELGAGAVAKAVNTVLLVLEIEKADKDNQMVQYQVTQNMMTNYGGKGMIDGVKRDSMAGVTFSQEVVLEFLIRFVVKAAGGAGTTGSRGIKAENLANQIKAELAAEQDEQDEPVSQLQDVDTEE